MIYSTSSHSQSFVTSWNFLYFLIPFRSLRPPSMTSTKPKDSYPRLTDPIVYGMTAGGPLYILQTRSRQYALVQASVLTSITNTESIGLDNTTSHIRILPTRSYRSDEKQNAIRSSLKSIVWVAQNARYTIVAVNTHTHRVEYMWRTSLRYVLGRSEAARRNAGNCSQGRLRGLCCCSAVPGVSTARLRVSDL